MFLPNLLYTRVQSFLLRGDQILYPVGQELVSELRLTPRPFLTLSNGVPAEYPGTFTTSTLQLPELPERHTALHSNTSNVGTS